MLKFSFKTTLLIIFVLVVYFNINSNKQILANQFVKQRATQIQSSDLRINILFRNSILALSGKDFIIEDELNYIELGELYENINVNKNIIIIHIKSLNEKQVYDIFIYDDFILKVSPNTKISRSHVFSIELTSPAFKTSRGIKIGDDLSDVIKKYGLNNNLKTNTYYCYYFEHKFIYFYFDKNDSINRIILELL